MALSTVHRRSFVSTVLLARTWDKATTLIELRSEAKARGLSTKGNKSTLIARIQDHDHTSMVARNSDFPAIKLPNLSKPTPNAPVQVPYLPDFWNSAQFKPVAPLKHQLPKVHVVSGSVTHYNGGPTHNLEEEEEEGSPPVGQEIGLWADFWESLGLSRSFRPLRTLADASNRASQNDESHSRPLTDEERKGLYILFGLVGGSWLVGALVNRAEEQH